MIPEKLLKPYEPKKTEERIYKVWEDSGYFNPDNLPGPRKKTFSILLPLPNANDPLHMGHALFTVEDIMTRYHRMKGEAALWLPGGDHAGIETQFVFERELAKKGKSRFDFDRKTLFKMIEDFVEKNKSINREQLKKLGFSLDWSRYHYSLEPKILETVMETFRKLHRDGLIYRGERIVNFCTKCGTAFSDLEVDYAEKNDFLYYLDYGTLQIATTRPETIFADVAVAVNPSDKRYKKLIGSKAVVPLINKEIPVIAEKSIEMNFGSGALKVTPGHDAADFEIGRKNNLEIISIIDRNGQMTNLPEKYRSMRVNQARKEVVRDLTESGKLLRIEELRHSVGICYRCQTTIEPLIMPQWFVKIETLAKPALEAVKKKKTKIVPQKRFEKLYLDWMKNIRDWNISRQIVWGPRIPVWYCLDCNQNILINFIDAGGKKISKTYQELKEKYSFSEIKNGLQWLAADKNVFYSLDEKPCQKCRGKNILQETDTFDTWFLSGQWPLTTLGYPHGQDFKNFYPTSVLDTLWDILFFWVARMMMLGLYLAKKVPFKIIHLHSRVVDAKGQKMSKSKNNVIDPLEMVKKYGADALRMAVVFGSAPGSDIHVSEDKIRGMKNFSNKVWNSARFVLGSAVDKGNKNDKKYLLEFKKIKKEVTKNIDNFRFDLAAEKIYRYFWHTFCDKIIEENKKGNVSKNILLEIFSAALVFLHPFMPFLTEEIWSMLSKKNLLMIEPWPKI